MSDNHEKAQDLLIRKELIDDILNSPAGEVVKMASASTTKVTRTQVREEGFQRAILPYDPVTNAELAYLGDSELAGVWFEMEPDSPPARSIPYNATPNTFAYRAEKYIVLLSIISTEEATKNIHELRNYKTDIRQIVSDNMLRDIHTEEDVSFITTVDRIVGSQVSLSTAPGIEVQNVNLEGSFSRQTLKRAQSFLTERRLPPGVFLVNQRTANELLGWHHDEIGGTLAQEIMLRGHKALNKFELFGVPYISTIKNDLVLNGYMYQFAEKQFLGNALMLDDIKVTIKREYEVIRMRAQETVGFTIGNTRGVQKLQFAIGN